LIDGKDNAQKRVVLIKNDKSSNAAAQTRNQEDLTRLNADIVLYDAAIKAIEALVQSSSPYKTSLSSVTSALADSCANSKALQESNKKVQEALTSNTTAAADCKAKSDALTAAIAAAPK